MSKSSRFRRELRGRPDRKLVSAIMLFFFSAFLLIALKGELHWQGFVLAVVVPALIYIATMWLPRFFPADKLLLSIANFLCALGVLVLYSTDLIKGTNYGMQQAIYYGVGIAAMLVCILLVRYIRYWRVFIYLIAVCALGLICLPLVFGTEVFGATNWIVDRRHQPAAQRSGEARAAAGVELFHEPAAVLAMADLFGVLHGRADAPGRPGHGADLLHRHLDALFRLHRQPCG